MLDGNGCCVDDILEGRDVEENESNNNSENHGWEQRKVLFGG